MFNSANSVLSGVSGTLSCGVNVIGHGLNLASIGISRINGWLNQRKVIPINAAMCLGGTLIGAATSNPLIAAVPIVIALALPLVNKSIARYRPDFDGLEHVYVFMGASLTTIVLRELTKNAFFLLKEEKIYLVDQFSVISNLMQIACVQYGILVLTHQLYRFDRINQGELVTPLLFFCELNFKKIDEMGNEEKTKSLAMIAHNLAMIAHNMFIRCLIVFGANPNYKTPLGATPLSRACYSGNLEIVKLLESHGALIAPEKALSLIKGCFASSRPDVSGVVQFLISKLKSPLSPEWVDEYVSCSQDFLTTNISCMQVVFRYMAESGITFDSLQCDTLWRKAWRTIEPQDYVEDGTLPEVTRHTKVLLECGVLMPNAIREVQDPLLFKICEEYFKENSKNYLHGRVRPTRNELSFLVNDTNLFGHIDAFLS